MKWSRAGVAIGVALSVGACVVHVRDDSSRPAPPPPPPPGAPVAAARPAPPPPPAPRPAPPRAPAPASAPAPAPAGPTVVHIAALHLPGRLVHPPPSENLVVHLNVQALRLKMRPNRTCGPRESTPGHWIHIDCNQYQPITVAKPPSPRKVKIMMLGGLKLDSAGRQRGARRRRSPGRRHRGAHQGPGAGRLVHGVLALERDGQRDPPPEQAGHDLVDPHLVALRLPRHEDRGRRHGEQGNHDLGRVALRRARRV